MCRKNMVLAAALIAFGAGLLIGQCIESGFVRFLLAVGSIVIGIGLLQGNRRHK